MNDDQSKLAAQLVFTNAARSVRRGYLNTKSIIRDLNLIDDAKDGNDGAETVLEGIKAMTTRGEKKDAQLDALLKQNNELMKKLADHQPK
tara:strand:- start:55 stop:324 length:270 start_codon:yes stop_codon:yes gene_type:complete